MASVFIFCLSYALLLFVILAGICFILITLYIYYQHAKYAHIPGPLRTSFFMGNSPVFIKTGHFFSLIAEWYTEFGPLFVFFVMHKPYVLSSDHRVIKAILTRSTFMKVKESYRPLEALFGARFMGHGLVTEMDHAAWTRRRALFNPAFHRKYLMGLMDQFNSSSDHLINHLTQFADGRTEVKMLDEFGRLTLDIIAKVGFGLNEDVISQPDKRLCQLMPELCAGMKEMYRKPYLEFSPLPRHVAFRRKSRASVKELRAIGRRCIEARIAALTRGDEAIPRDILTYILEASHNLSDQSFGMEDMLDEFCTFFGAGQETTATLLAFFILHLGRNPHIMARLREEVLSVLEDKDFVEYADVTKMSYLGLVMKEVFRISPPVGGATRKLHCDTEMSGYKVPAGATFMTSMLVMGRHEDHFKDPLTFDPDRFTRDEDNPLFALFPFSLGARNCIGQIFAQIETKVIISKLVKTFDFQLVPGQGLDFVEGVTLKPKDGCKTFLTLRT